MNLYIKLCSLDVGISLSDIGVYVIFDDLKSSDDDSVFGTFVGDYFTRSTTFTCVFNQSKS